jgi:medium-chain acyl-[acyl-carrier-protein] hydrolase
LLGGIDDPLISPAQLTEWASLFESVVEAFWFEGGHFFINNRSDEVLSFLNSAVLAFNLRCMPAHERILDVAF